MKRLFIAEKPSMGKAIAQGLDKSDKAQLAGSGCIHVGEDTVTWLFGHMLEQFSPDDYDEKYKMWKIEDLPILPTKWKLKVKKGAKRQFDIVKKLAQQAEAIVHAGDPDREGQLLVDEFLNYVGVLGTEKRIDRILLNALDPASIRAELARIRPNKDFVGLRNSALARQRADWLIGMNLSRIYSILARGAGYDMAIRVGRVKTPTMGLVVRREIEIRSFQPKAFFTPRIRFRHANGEFVAKWKADGRDGTDEEGRVRKKEVAEAILQNAKGAAGRIEKVEAKRGEAKQRLPYSLSTLQVEAGRITGFSPQKILDIQQALYEKKLTTYPRSDCQYLPQSQHPDAPAILAHLAAQDAPFAAFAKRADPSITSRAWNDKKITAHHAIIPTTAKADLAALSQDEKKLYELIARSYIAQFFPPQEFLATHVEASAGGEVFLASGNVILQEGWKAIYKRMEKGSKEGKEEEGTAPLPDMQEGDSAEVADATLAEGVTKPPERYTKASLIQAMKEIHKHVLDKSLSKNLKECAGIGTEATRAGMLEELQQAGFFQEQGKHLVPTDLAVTFCRILPEDLVYPDLTARWEDALDKIGNRQMTLADFEEQQAEYIDTLLREAKEAKIPPPKNAVRCPACKKPLRKKTTKKGKPFWSCGNPACNKAFGDEKGKPGKEWTFDKK